MLQQCQDAAPARFLSHHPAQPQTCGPCKGSNLTWKVSDQLVEEAITSSVPELSKTGCWAGQPRLWPRRSSLDSHRDLKAHKPVNHSQYLPQDTQRKLSVAFLSPVLSNNKPPFLCFLLLEPRPSAFPWAFPISMLSAPVLTHLQTLPGPLGWDSRRGRGEMVWVRWLCKGC